MAIPDARPRLLYVISEDWYFCSHRLPLALAAKAAGFDVAVATRVGSAGERIKAAGLRLYPLGLVRGSLNPWRELATFLELLRIYRCERPQIVHQVAAKPVIYGSLAALMLGVPHVVNALAGLGYIFSSTNLKARLLRPVALAAYRLLLSRTGNRLIMQNPDDRDLFVKLRLAPAESIQVIRGAGVDIDSFVPCPEPLGPPVVVMPARLLWDKGVGEFVEAASILKKAGIVARFVLVGDRDAENPTAVPEASLDAWLESGVVECWGHQADMVKVLHSAHIVCLPSYREGLPKALLEAAACGRPIVTTDVPGCREIVHPGENGLLVPVRDAQALSKSLASLIADACLRQRMGAAGRRLAEGEFSQAQVIRETLACYQALCPC